MKAKFGLSATSGSWGLVNVLELFMEDYRVFFSCWFRKSTWVAGESTSGRRCSYPGPMPLLPSLASIWRTYGAKASIQRHYKKLLFYERRKIGDFDLPVYAICVGCGQLAVDIPWERSQWNFALAFPNPSVARCTGIHSGQAIRLRPPIKSR